MTTMSTGSCPLPMYSFCTLPQPAKRNIHKKNLYLYSVQPGGDQNSSTAAHHHHLTPVRTPLNRASAQLYTRSGTPWSENLDLETAERVRSLIGQSILNI